MAANAHQIAAGSQAFARAAARRTGLRRAHIGSLRTAMDRLLLASRPGRTTKAGRILCYHSVGTPAWGVNDVRPQRFRRQLEAALEAGFTFVAAAQIARTGGTADQLALTFDDGLMSVATQAAPVLAELHIPWTLFVVSDWLDGRHPFAPGLLMTWHDVERVAYGGAEIGSHSVSHGDFSRMSAERITSELSESREAIAAHLGIRTTAFAIPNGRQRDWPQSAANSATAAGYETIYAACEDRRAPGTVGRTMITSWDGQRLFRAALRGAFDGWEESIL